MGISKYHQALLDSAHCSLSVDYRHRPFTVSEQEHMVYYLAHRSPYMPSTQRWQFVPSESNRPYNNHVSRAGNRIWQELCESVGAET